MEVISSQKLKNAMIRKAMGVSALAKLAKVQTKIISKFLKTNSNIRLSTLGKISAALNCDGEELILKEM